MTPTDLHTEAKRLWKLPVFKEMNRGRKLPDITVRQSKTRGRASGHCWWYQHRIVVTLGSWVGMNYAVLLHELVHDIVGSEGHSRKFWTTVRRAAREAYPEADFEFHKGPERGWQMDEWVASRIPV